jgi:predicted DNA-binding transcriptional regulator AlpA
VSRSALPFRAPTPPPDRGPLLTPEQVADLVGGVSAAWIRRTVPGKLVLGQRTVRWYRDDVLRWIASRQHGEVAPGRIGSPAR